MLFKSYFILFFALIIPFGLFGQDPSYIIYDTKDGLPSSEVYFAEIDKNGLLWFSTDRGVCTFDGYDFKAYTTNDGLVDNTNFRILKDSKERLWFTGYSGNLTIYEDGKFSPYIFNDSLSFFLKGYWLDHLFESKDGYLYLNNHFRWTHSVVRISNSEAPEIFTEKNISDQKSHFQFQDESVYKFEDNAISFGPKIKGKEGFPVKFYDKIDSTWFLIKQDSLFKLNNNGDFIQAAESKHLFSKVYKDRDNNLLSFGSEGLFIYPDCNFNLTPTHYFEGVAISDVLQDYEGNYWLTTLKKGIIFVPSFQIKTLQLPIGTSDRFLSIGKMEHNIIFGNENRELLHCNKKNECKTFLINNDYSKQIKHICPDRNGFYFSGYEAEEKNEAVIISKADMMANFKITMANEEIFYFIERGYFLKIKERDINKNAVDNKQTGVPKHKDYKGKTTKIIQTKNENIWLGSLKGLYKIDNIDHNITTPVYTADKKPYGRVSDIVEAINNNIWVATIGNGLHYYNTEKKINYTINKKQGLTSNLVNHILIQNDTTIWIATNKGINIINYEYAGDSISVHRVRNLTTRDGLVSNFIYDIDIWNDNVYLATDKGICYFPPSIIDKEHSAVPIQINELIVNDSTYLAKDSLEFNHYQNDFFIHFTGLNFRKNNESSFYKYRLNSNNDNGAWHATNEKNIRYSNLAPGNYLFEVNAQNNASQWNEEAANIFFTIHPHFSQTNWFKALSILLGFGLLYLFYNIQMKRVQSREKANTQLEKAQLRMREAELSALRNQMNPHFIYNALNSIQNFIYKKDFEKANYYLVKFSRLMRSSLNFSRLDFITIKEELVFLNAYIELEQMRFPNKFICNFIVADDLPINALMIPSLLLQPVLENVIKHAFKNNVDTGKMDVHFTQNNKNQLVIVIEDNGPGILINAEQSNSQNHAHKSLGLEIIKNRIDLINESNPTNVSSMTLINKNEVEGTKTGLKVVFILPEIYR